MTRTASILSALALFFLAAAPAFAGKPSKNTPAPTPTTTTTTGPLFGFNDNGVAFGQLSATTDALLAGQDGATTSRITFDWRYAEAAQGVWNLAQYDAIYNADIAKGVRPVFILAFAP